MKRLFTKSDLKTGDIIVLRNGEPGFVYRENQMVLYPRSHSDLLYAFKEDLCTNTWDAGRDIMYVYRAPYRSQIDFFNYTDYENVFDRVSGKIYKENPDPKPQPEQKPRRRKKEQAEEKARIRSIIICSANRNWLVCSGSPDLEKNKMNLLEYPSMDYMNLNELPLDVVSIPDSNGLVIVFFPFQDQRWLERKKAPSRKAWKEPIRPLIRIPETGQKIYSRCMICRQDRNGQFQSIHEEDLPKIMSVMTL